MIFSKKIGFTFLDHALVGARNLVIHFTAKNP